MEGRLCQSMATLLDPKERADLFRRVAIREMAQKKGAKIAGQRVKEREKLMNDMRQQDRLARQRAVDASMARLDRWEHKTKAHPFTVDLWKEDEKLYKAGQKRMEAERRQRLQDDKVERMTHAALDQAVLNEQDELGTLRAEKRELLFQQKHLKAVLEYTKKSEKVERIQQTNRDARAELQRKRDEREMQQAQAMGDFYAGVCRPQRSRRQRAERAGRAEVNVVPPRSHSASSASAADATQARLEDTSFIPAAELGVDTDQDDADEETARPGDLTARGDLPGAEPRQGDRSEPTRDEGDEAPDGSPSQRGSGGRSRRPKKPPPSVPQLAISSAPSAVPAAIAAEKKDAAIAQLAGKSITGNLPASSPSKEGASASVTLPAGSPAHRGAGGRSRQQKGVSQLADMSASGSLPPASPSSEKSHGARLTEEQSVSQLADMSAAGSLLADSPSSEKSRRRSVKQEQSLPQLAEMSAAGSLPADSPSSEKSRGRSVKQEQSLSQLAELSAAGSLLADSPSSQKSRGRSVKQEQTLSQLAEMSAAGSLPADSPSSEKSRGRSVKQEQSLSQLAEMSAAGSLPADSPSSEKSRGRSVKQEQSLSQLAEMSAAGNLFAESPSPAGSRSPRLEEDLDVAEELRRTLRPAVIICVLGGTAFQDPASEELTTLLATQVSTRCSNNAVFITGGMKGVQETFARHCNPGTRVYNMLPEGESSGYGVGSDIAAGADLDERKRIFAQVGDIYVTVEGGPGVAMEAGVAFERGARIVPMMRTGGASSGMFKFPQGALVRPGFVAEDHWDLLSSQEVPVYKSAQAAAEIVAQAAAEIWEGFSRQSQSVSQLAGASASGILPGASPSAGGSHGSRQRQDKGISQLAGASASGTLPAASPSAGESRGSRQKKDQSVSFLADASASGTLPAASPSHDTSGGRKQREDQATAKLASASAASRGSSGGSGTQKGVSSVSGKSASGHSEDDAEPSPVKKKASVAFSDIEAGPSPVKNRASGSFSEFDEDEAKSSPVKSRASGSLSEFEEDEDDGEDFDAETPMLAASLGASPHEYDEQGRSEATRRLRKAG